MELQMEFSVHNSDLNTSKGRDKKRPRRQSSDKVERKIIEKNRRNHMKNLYSNLNSLLPRHDSKEPLSLPDQIDEALNHIQRLKTKLNEYREKKESLMGRKGSYACSTAVSVSLKSPELKINQHGSAMEVVLTTGTDSQFMFYDMIEILNQHGAEVLHANFTAVGDTVFHVVHAEIGAFVGAEILKTKLNQLVYGSSFEDDQLQQQLWSFELEPETWDLNYEIYPETWDFSVML